MRFAVSYGIPKTSSLVQISNTTPRVYQENQTNDIMTVLVGLAVSNFDRATKSTKDGNLGPGDLFSGLTATFCISFQHCTSISGSDVW